MSGAWGAMPGGAWGGSKQSEIQDDEEAPASSSNPAGSTGAYGIGGGGGGAFKSAFGMGSKSAEASQSDSMKEQLFTGPASTADGNLSAKEKELLAKEAELKKKMAELTEVEKNLVAKGAIIKKKNWPVCWPMRYHNIFEEVPESSRRVVKEVYMAWYGLILCLSVNLFCASAMLGTSERGVIYSFVLALIYFFLGIPLSVVLWYFRLYEGAKSDSTFGYIGFFISFCIHLGFCTWAAIGVPFSSESWSFAGFFTAMAGYDVSFFIGTIYLIGAILWTLEASYSFWCLKDVYFFFRGAGGVEQVKQQLALQALNHSLQSRR